MKTKQTKIDRSAAKWLPGAMALAATTASSQAAIVQITLTGNKYSTVGDETLKADLTGDGGPDVGFTNMFRFVGVGAGAVQVYVNGGRISAGRSQNTFLVDAGFTDGGVGVRDMTDGSPLLISYLNPITFTDALINGGTPTGGWLQVNAFNTNASGHTVELARLIFDDANPTRPSFGAIPDVQTEWVAAIPEPGSNLALLALGAGGLTLRRRLKRAA